MAAPRSPRRRRLMFGCAALLIGSVLSLVALEVALRYLTPSLLGSVAETQGMVEAAPGRTVRPVPGYHGSMTVNGRATTVRINQAGLRGPELPADLGETRRVLVLGDSMTFGSGVEDSETFSAQLDTELRQQLGGVVVLNGGVPAYGVRESVLRLGRLDASVAPDAVVLCYYLGNDFEDDAYVDRRVVDGFMLKRSTADAIASLWRGRLALKSRVWLLAERLLASVPGVTDIYTLIQQADRPAAAERSAFEGWPTESAQRRECLFMDAEPPGQAQQAAFERLEVAFSELGALAGERPVLVALLPTYRHCIPGAYALSMKELGLDPDRHRQGNAQRAVVQAALAAGLRCVDLTEPLSGDPEIATYFIPGDFHFNPVGHRAVAALLAPELVSLLGR